MVEEEEEENVPSIEVLESTPVVGNDGGDLGGRR